MKFVERYLEKDPLKLSADDIETFVKKRVEESSTLDYKDIAILEKPEKVLKHVCGFANSFGGILFLGISESRVPSSDSSVKVYPEKITWGSGNPSKETIEHILRDGIEPEPAFTILPVRRSKGLSDAIYIVEVFPDSHAHFVKHDEGVYVRKNFETVRLATRDLIRFVGERASLQKCAYFRVQLEFALIEFMENWLIRTSDFDQIGPYPLDVHEQRKRILSAYKGLMESDEKQLLVRFAELPIYNLSKLDTAYEEFMSEIERAEGYPHSELSPEEQTLLIYLKEEIDRSHHIFNIDAFIGGMARVTGRKVDEVTKLSELKGNGRSFEREYLAHLRLMKDLAKTVIAMQEKIDEMKERYGSLAVDYSRFSD